MGTRLSTMSCMMIRKRDDAVNSGSSEAGDVEGLELETMETEIWKNLPEDILLKKIVSKLPFNVLLEFCSVSREWNRFIRSMNNSPNCHSKKSILIQSLIPLRVLDTHNDGGRWIHPSPYLPNLRVLASAGGLLCMSTDRFGELLIRNPVTKSERRLQMPFDPQHGNCLDRVFQIQSGVSNPGRWMTKLIYSGWLRVGLTYRTKTNSYQVIVAALSSRLPGATVIYDSQTMEWKTGPSIPQGIRFELNSIPSQCGRYFYCAIICGVPSYLLEFDFDKNKWAYFRIALNMGIPEGLIEHRGTVLLLTRAYPGPEEFSVYELHMRLRHSQHTYGEYKWELRTSDHMPQMLSKKVYGAMRTRAENLLMKLGDRYVQCYGKGDLLFFVGTSVEKWDSTSHIDFLNVGMCRGRDSCDVVEPARSLYFMRTYLRVWIHDISDSADRVLQLTDWEFEGYNDANLSYFQLFNPSLTSRP